MTSVTRIFPSILLITSTCSIICGAACDSIGDASPECQMQIVGAQPATQLGIRPWVALWITGDASCTGTVADDVRVSMYETHPATTYRGDAMMTSKQAIGNTTVCAVYEWPEWEHGASHWSIIVTPPARSSDDEKLPRAIGLIPSQVEGLEPDGMLPFWLVGDEFALYLPTPTNTANCWPNSGK